MKIGHLHTAKQKDMPKYCDAILIRVGYEQWDYAIKHSVNFLSLKYGKATSREDERYKIYPEGQTYGDWFAISQRYDVVFLSLNFDSYPGSIEFFEFVRGVLDIFYSISKWDGTKQLILGCGNETFEKRGNVEKVLEVVINVNDGLNSSHIKNADLCFWNQKIKTDKEQEAVKILVQLDSIKDLCRYFGFQSLGTSLSDIDKYCKLAKSFGYRRIDVELGNKRYDFDTIKKQVDKINALEVEQAYIMALNCDKKLTDKYTDWGKYALKIYDGNNVYKIRDKAKLMDYVQDFRDEKEVEEQMILKIYKKWSRGLPIKFVQRAINTWLEDLVGSGQTPDWHPLDVDGIFGPLTESGIKFFQVKLKITEKELGKIGKETMTALASKRVSEWAEFCSRWSYGER